MNGVRKGMKVKDGSYDNRECRKVRVRKRREK